MLKKLDNLNPADYTVEERRELVARAIEMEPERFDMSVYGNWETGYDCGTVGCIAGWTVWLFDREKYAVDKFNEYIAGEILGLTNSESEFLFYARWHPMGMNHVTAAEAAAELRRWKK